MSIQRLMENPPAAAGAPVQPPTYEIRLDCGACHAAQSMIPTRIPRFTTIVRGIGVVTLIPSILGILLAVAMLHNAWGMVPSTADLESKGSAAALSGLSATFGIFFAFGLGFVSIVGSLLGWLLLMEKKVYRCLRCGFIIERS